VVVEEIPPFHMFEVPEKALYNCNKLLIIITFSAAAAITNSSSIADLFSQDQILYINIVISITIPNTFSLFSVPVTVTCNFLCQ